MKAIMVLAAAYLVFSIAPARSGEGPGGRVQAAASDSPHALVRLRVADLAMLRNQASQRIRALHRRDPESDALVDAIRGEPDPVAKEAQWSAWLDALAASKALQPAQIEALAALKSISPTTGIAHHEFPSRTVPAFAVAERAAVLLDRNARSIRARELAGRPEKLTEALESDPDSPAFRDGLKALELVSPALLANVVEIHRRRMPFAAGASRILLKAAETAPGQRRLLPEIVRLGDADTARRALRMALDRRLPQLAEMADAALPRTALGGLALIAARQSGKHPDRFCWPLLGDPVLGADAARMLAAESDRLLVEIPTRIDGASGLARLRMLLALRWRNTVASRTMLAELAEASWLSEQQRREVLSWL